METFLILTHVAKHKRDGAREGISKILLNLIQVPYSYRIFYRLISCNKIILKALRELNSEVRH